MKQKSIGLVIVAMISVGIVTGLVLGYTPSGIPGFSSGIPSSGYDTSAQMSDEVNAFVTKSDSSPGKTFSVSLKDDAGAGDTP